MKLPLVFVVVLFILWTPLVHAADIDRSLTLLPLSSEEKAFVLDELERLERSDLHQRDTLIALYLGKEALYRQELILAHYDLLLEQFKDIRDYYIAEKKSTRNFRPSLLDFEETLAVYTLSHDQIQSQYSDLSVYDYTSVEVRSFISSLVESQDIFLNVQEAHHKSLQFVGGMS